MQTIQMALEEVHMDPANVRRHNEKNLQAIMASLKKFGQQKPIVINRKNIVIAGNGTLEAAKALGWLDISVVRTELGDFDATAYAIADNRTAELAEWDDEALMKQLSALDIEDSALVSAAGFSSEELSKMVDGLIGEEEIKEIMIDEVKEHCLFVTCENEGQLRELFNEFEGRGLEVKLV